jgi:hypothetical protein
MRLVAAQVAGSGRDDLFLGDDQGYATILLAATNGSMSAAASSPFLMAAGSRGFALAPLDEDGVLDLAVADSSTGALLLFSGDGAGGFAPLGDPIPVGSSPLAVAAEYYDVGPTVDLAVLDAADRTVDVLLGDGEGAFEAAATSPVYLPAGEKLDLVPLVNAIAPNYSAHLLVLQQRDSGDAEVMELLNHGYADFELTAGPRRIGGVTDRIHVAPLSEDAITDLGWADFRGGVVRVAFGTPADL